MDTDVVNLTKELRPDIETEIVALDEAILGKITLKLLLPIEKGLKLEGFYRQLALDEMTENISRLQVVLDRCVFTSRGRVY